MKEYAINEYFILIDCSSTGINFYCVKLYLVKECLELVVTDIILNNLMLHDNDLFLIMDINF